MVPKPLYTCSTTSAMDHHTRNRLCPHHSQQQPKAQLGCRRPPQNLRRPQRAQLNLPRPQRLQQPAQVAMPGPTARWLSCIIQMRLHWPLRAAQQAPQSCLQVRPNAICSSEATDISSSCLYNEVMLLHASLTLDEHMFRCNIEV